MNKPQSHRDHRAVRKHSLLPSLCALWLCGYLSSAHADTITVGLFAPTAPFPSTAARVELASKLGEDVGKALGETGVGKVFARAGDFAAAVKKGEVAVALVDASYLAVAGGKLRLGVSHRGVGKKKK